jgi:hypothetical protein
MKLTVRLLLVTLILLVLSAVCVYAEPPGFARNFSYKQADGAVDILKGDTVIARYVYKDTTRPYIYPLLSPSGLAVTRNFPMKEVAGEPKDHPHQRSMWIGFGDVNGVDFWADTDKSGKIVQKSIDFNPISVGPYWSIHTTNDWMLPNGKKLMQDDRKVAFYSCKYGTLIVTAIMLQATECTVKFGDTKEGFFAVRVAPSMVLKGGKGHILNSQDDVDAKAWGKSAKWVDYTGEVNGKPVGITMFDSHYNYGYPTYWHARDYGLMAANPFGGKAFTGDAKNESSFSIPYTSSVQFRYITLIHDGKVDAKTLNALADEVAGKPAAPPPVPGKTGKTTPTPTSPSKTMVPKPEQTQTTTPTTPTTPAVPQTERPRGESSE